MPTNNQLCQTYSTLFDFERAQNFRSKGRFCDLVIQSAANDNKEFIKCHRVILASLSPFFEDKLGKGGISTLYIPDVEHETLEILIDYMYGSGGEITLNRENVFKIYAGAKHLQLNQLESWCLEFVRSLVTVEDVMQVFKFSITESQKALKKSCIKFIVKNVQKVKSYGFLDLDCEQVKSLVELGIENQTLAKADILLAVIEWLQTNTEERVEHAFSLVSKIPLAEIDLKILRRLIKENDFLRSNPEIYSLYVDAVEEKGLQFEQAQIEKRKAEELAMKEKAVTDCEHPPELGSSKRARFSTGNEYKPRMKKPLVYFFSKKVFQPLGLQHSIVSFDLETKETEILGSNIDFRRNKNIVCYKHKIYCLGGIVQEDQRNPVSVFDVLTKSWEENGPDHVERRSGLKTVVLDDYLYAVGGWTHSGDSCDVERLKIQKPYGQWEKISKLPFGLCGFGICVANSGIYVIGGNTCARSRVINSSVICYTPQSNQWVKKESMRNLKTRFAVAVVGRDIYALGGSKSMVSKKDGLSSVDIYDTELDCWRVGIPMNKNRHCFAAIVYNNCIYALGGDCVQDPTMERFRIERQVWEDMGALPNYGYYSSADLHVEEL